MCLNCTTDASAPSPELVLMEGAFTPTKHRHTVEDSGSTLACIDNMRRIDDDGKSTKHDSISCIDDLRQEAASSPPALAIDEGMDLNCQNVQDCDECLSCIEVMRLIDCTSPTPEPARIDKLEKSLQRMRLAFAAQLPREIIQHPDNVLRSSRRRSTSESEEQRLARAVSACVTEHALSPPTSPISACGTEQPKHDSVLWFDASAVFAAAACPNGRAGVKLAMEQSMCWKMK